MSFCECDWADAMADVNVNFLAKQAPAMAPPTHIDEQILPRIRWVPIGKSNCYLDAERSQSNPIYKIAVDILKQTNFFRAFTASSTIPAIYIQQFWDTICYDRIAGGYKCQLDEQWFDLTKDTLRDALQITPVNNNKAFSSPPTPDTLIQFVNDLGYPKEVRHLSDVVTNDMFQPWRALTTIINLCLTGKTSGFERPRAPVLQILWGVINRAHIDYAERMWEEFTQSIHTFTEDKKNLAQQTQGKKKATLIVIPSVSAKGTKREVFGMPIPNELITDDIRGADYYDAYLKKVAKHHRYLAGEEVKADTTKGIEERLKEIHDDHIGVLSHLWCSGKLILESISHFQRRRTSAQLKPSGHDESSSLYAELGLTESDTESDKEVPPVVKSGALDEGQALLTVDDPVIPEEPAQICRHVVSSSNT
ncbi:hypothetical protein Tco_0291454 [Tanacetum coccineum]